MATTTEQRLDTHEQVCALRYQNIELQFRSSNARLKRIEQLMIAAASGVIVGFGSIIIMLVQMKG
jgi:hypothetical protein